MQIVSIRNACVVAAMATIALLATWAMKSRATDAQASNATAAGKVQADMVVRGHIEPVGRVLTLQGPATGGVVRSLRAGQGEHVESGQIVALLEGYETQSAAVSVAERSLAYSKMLSSQVGASAKKANVSAQQNVVDAKRVELLRAQREQQRQETLLDKQMVSMQALDRARADTGVATAGLEQAQHALVALDEVRDIDKAVAAAKVTVDVAMLEKARAELERTIVRAPMSGTVLSITTRQGEAIGENGIMRMAALEHLMVIAEVDEHFIPRLHPDTQAVIEGALLPQPIPAKIRYLGKEVFKQKRAISDTLIGRDARVIEVELDPQTALPLILGGEVDVRFKPGKP